ncbi:MAG: LLM class flavin-dependent oxidoreductase [Gammaproteobacteria bacterium]|nr:LLM class flavin-dependent oxidoreductase [Gammaproteobacteria bacterium]MBI5616086.1 LLM class flavin-dependent oxidoreductase [Gammaproteobacteria bacterium]
MKFSVIFSFVAPPGSATRHIDTFREFRKLVPLIEDLGYHGVHVTEHHFQVDGFLPSPLLVLAQAAGLTRRVKLVPNILVSTLYRPVQVLEDLATLDNLSEGRLILGTAPGYAIQEFEGRGVSYADRFRLHEEIIDFIQKAWRTPDDIGFEGKYFSVPGLKLSPTPIQRELPIWYGVSGPKLIKRAAERRAVLAASPRHTVSELEGHYARYMEAAARVGYQPPERPIFREALVLDTTEEAERYGIPGTDGLFNIYGRTSASGERALYTDGGALVTDVAMVQYRAMASRYLVGDPALARERLVELKQALDPTEIVLRMQMPGLPTEKLERSLRLFAEKVMPDFAS